MTWIPVPQARADEILKTIDLNKDGKVNFNEFIECFRLVHH